MAGLGWACLGFGCAVVLTGCGGGEAPGSGIAMDKGGTGGAAGAAGSLALGLPMGGAGAGGTGVGTGATDGGGAPPVQLHTCPVTPEPSCPAKSVPGADITDAAAITALQGVTQIDGDLTIRKVSGLDALSCLETISGDLRIDVFSDDTLATLWGLRNLQTVGQTIEISPDAELHVDCGFSRLSSIGADYFTGGAFDVDGDVAGELDLSKLETNKHFRINGSNLSKVTLPSNTSIVQGQLSFQSNSKLAEVVGFGGITFTPDNISVGGAYSVMITNNPLLSECRARELGQLYIDAGDAPDTVTIMGNLACAM